MLIIYVQEKAVITLKQILKLKYTYEFVYLTLIYRSSITTIWFVAFLPIWLKTPISLTSELRLNVEQEALRSAVNTFLLTNSKNISLVFEYSSTNKKVAPN